MPLPQEISSLTSPIDRSLVDTNDGSVPDSRPHFAFWPRRLARTTRPLPAWTRYFLILFEPIIVPICTAAGLPIFKR